jgi:hypothetical protein
VRRCSRRIAALVVLLVVPGCDVGGEPVSEPASDSESVSVFDLETGMCIDGVGDAEGRVDAFDVVDCGDPHDGEVFSIFDIDGGDDAEFPGPESVEDAAATGCEERFDRYVGISYQESRFQATFVAPTEATWGDGDREVVCFAYVPEGVLRESIEGTAE